MITTGVSALKVRLGSCVRKVREWRGVYVTGAGGTVAEIRPSTDLADEQVDSELRRLAQAGKVRLGARNRPEVYVETGVSASAEAVQSLLHESRSEYPTCA